LSMQVTAADGKMRFWRNTSIATLGAGQTATLPAGTLGYEWDTDIDNGFRPPGAIPLSTSTYTMTQDLMLDYGATYGAGSVTHHLVLYRAPSGALVFGAGTVQWAWGLDNDHDGNVNNTADIRMQQATMNLFADMGVQPTTMQPGLVPATKSTDITAPTAVITSPVAGANVSYGSPVNITGTASDAAAGVVGAVEVSVDGGQSWHPATGRAQWSYNWSPWAFSGSATIMARAIDDSGNIQNPAAAVNFNVTGQPACPCSIWTNSTVPGTPNSGDAASIEVGVKFRSDVGGYITGVRFYKSSANTGTHIGHLWTAPGGLLASVTFTNETASGWQQANFASPVLISANTTYVVSYYAPNGGYSDDEPYFFAGPTDRPPLHAPADQAVGGNGLYLYASGGGFPRSSFNSANYWVDLIFVPSTPWNISGTISGGSGATVTLAGPTNGTAIADSSGNYTFSGVQNGTYTVTPSGGGYNFSPTSLNVTVNGATASGVNFNATPLPKYTLSGTIAGGTGATVSLSGPVTATTTADSSGNYSFTAPTGTYTVSPSKAGYGFSPASQTVSISNANIAGLNFTAAQLLSIWSSSATPVNTSESDPSAVELGVKFQSDVAGSVYGVRFYKGSANIGTHVGNLWTSTGTNLATVTFSNETASGWQQANFASPVAISANTVYVISYYAPNGGYAGDANVFSTSGVDNPPLHALANSVSSDGVYLYASGGGFPTNTFSATNYWVDVLFLPAVSFSISGTITGGAGATVALSGTAAASTTADSGGNYTFTGLVNGSYTVTPSKSGYTFTPTSLPVTVNGAGVTSVNFTANAVPTYSVSGTITGGGGSTVGLTGSAVASTTADSSGNYSFTGIANGSYTITPSKAGLAFTPTSLPVTVNGASVTGMNFSASVAPTYSISGTIAGGAGATVALSGAATASTTADSSGNYSFTGLANGSYTVTPSKSGYTFSPANAAVTINGSNLTGMNFTAKPALSIDANVFKDQGTKSTSVTTAAFSTTSGNELLLAFISADQVSASATTVTGVTGAGLTWALVLRTNKQKGTAEIWRAFSTSSLTNITVRATLSQSVTSSLSVISFRNVDTSGTNGSGAIGLTGTGNAAVGAPQANLVTTRNYSWVLGVGNDWDGATARNPGPGQTMVHQYLAPVGDTYWVQRQTNTAPVSGTSVPINDTAPTGDSYNLSICEVLPAP